MRLAQHLTALRAWCKQCLPGRWNPHVPRPGTVVMRGSMVKRLRSCMIMSTPAPRSTAPSSQHSHPPFAHLFVPKRQARAIREPIRYLLLELYTPRLSFLSPRPHEDPPPPDVPPASFPTSYRSPSVLLWAGRSSAPAPDSHVSCYTRSLPRQRLK